MGRKLIPEPLQAKWRLHRPKNDENAHTRGANGQTGSRNMAATHFLDSATSTSYSTPNTLWGLTRTVTELPGGNLSITPLLRSSDLEIFRIFMTNARFFRNSTNFFWNSNEAISFKFSGALVGQGFCRFMQKNPTHGFIVSTQSRPKFAKNQISNFHISPNWGAIRPNPRPFLSDPQGGNVQVSINWRGPPKGCLLYTSPRPRD